MHHIMLHPVLSPYGFQQMNQKCKKYRLDELELNLCNFTHNRSEAINTIFLPSLLCDPSSNLTVSPYPLIFHYNSVRSAFIEETHTMLYVPANPCERAVKNDTVVLMWVCVCVCVERKDSKHSWIKIWGDHHYPTPRRTQKPVIRLEEHAWMRGKHWPIEPLKLNSHSETEIKLKQSWFVDRLIQLMVIEI